MARLNIPIDDDLFKRVRVDVAENGTTTAQLVRDLIEKYFARKDKKKEVAA